MNIVIIQPVISEKSVQLGAANKYTFKVDKRANASQVRHSVENLFKVNVKAVNIINVPGKPKKVRGRRVMRASIKKAIVTLMPGQKIKLFEEVKE
ncbi:50S ribosomal protein L23 [Patescibacteria group bacterium]|nr:50S ribosomal protein L23 [Patescibacteria group bacterium]